MVIKSKKIKYKLLKQKMMKNMKLNVQKTTGIFCIVEYKQGHISGNCIDAMFARYY
jgi:hypothetical protein